MDIVLLGPPGVGKGTQGDLLSVWLRIPTVSSGDLFREALDRGTELGKIARSYMERGVYVPDDVTIAMVRERLSAVDCAGGVILDGFPRTVAQAVALSDLLREMGGRRVRLAALILAPTEVLVERLSGRWTCPNCGAVYHETHGPERVRGICDVCGTSLQRREDDTPELHRRRIQVYEEQTRPVIDHYRQAGVLAEIDGDRPVEQVQAELREVVCGSGGPGKGMADREA